ncbi:MAG: HIT domain-containing protein [Lachnospiraceae bacterium]|nr:HIT domain-containing protein [Lachnospiraceae bacterium]MBR4175704.1 HIT domain-containing protein [Lachnospiraceae bacterium]
MEDCIFCKLANGVFETNTLYEDDDFRIILDAGPATKGHALILPKAHYANIYEIPADLLAKAAVLAKEQAEHMTKVLGADGFNIVQNNGETAGQTVFHFHIHLIPRFKDDGQKIGWNPGSPDEQDQKKLCELLKR